MLHWKHAADFTTNGVDMSDLIVVKGLGGTMPHFGRVDIHNGWNEVGAIYDSNRPQHVLNSCLHDSPPARQPCEAGLRPSEERTLRRYKSA